MVIRVIYCDYYDWRNLSESGFLGCEDREDWRALNPEYPKISLILIQTIFAYFFEMTWTIFDEMSPIVDMTITGFWVV